MTVLGPDNAFWADGEWISWEEFGEEVVEHGGHLAELEREAAMRWRFPNADISLVPFFQDLLDLARDYHEWTGRHLQVYGDIGELFGAVVHGIRLHRNFAQGSDGRLGNDFVEIKTITPFNTYDRVSVRLDRHFNKLLVVKVDASFRVEGRLVAREDLKKIKGTSLTVTWGELQAAPLSMTRPQQRP